MPFLFACPHCGKQTSAADDYAGQSRPCAVCGATVLIPAPPAVRDVPAQRRASRRLAILLLLIGACAVGVVVVTALFLPALFSVRGPLRRPPCNNNMRWLGFALQEYEAAHGRLPMAALADEEGRPALSWRVAILPFLEEKDLYAHFDPSMDWDTPPNSWLLKDTPRVFQCPHDPRKEQGLSGYTSYVMPTGPRAVGDSAARDFDTLQSGDGLALIIMLVEMPDSGIAWTEPRDPTIDELVKWFTIAGQGKDRCHVNGINVVFCDGHVEFFHYGESPEYFRQLLVVDDGLPSDLAR